MAGGAFLLCLGALTGVIWITTALRELDLVASKGQTIFVFLQVTLLTLPGLVMVIAPIALFAAVIYTLNRLNSDSELIVMNAAGMSPLKVARPLGLLAVLVLGGVAYITIIAMPESFRNLRDMLTQIKADVVTKFLQEGRFTTLDKGITFHYREKAPNGAMLGIMIHDARDAAKQTTYLAERGRIVETGGSAYLVLEQGSVHRQQGTTDDSAIVAYDRYAIDLEQFGETDPNVVYKPRERSTLSLLSPDRNELYFQIQAGRFRAELHERFAGPLYALSCMMIGFAALGQARTTRQGRGAAIAAAVVALVALRIAGFGASSLAMRSAVFVPFMYAVPIGACAVCGWITWRAMTGRSMPQLDLKLGKLLPRNAASRLAMRLKVPGARPGSA
jgi:lipopolysaccharide export system permease protein